MKVLIIDDIPDSVKRIEDYCKDNQWDCNRVDFDKSYLQLVQFKPDVLVLDWKDEPSENESGRSILDLIWDVGFRPVIIFSGYADILKRDVDVIEKTKRSSLVQIIDKGDEEDVVEALKHLVPYVSAMSDFREDVGAVLIDSYNAIEFLKTEVDVAPQVVEYVLAHRLAAYFEDKYTSVINPSWVQYIYPPIGNNLSVCDVIRKNTQNEDGDTESPDNFLIILTPSCDLYRTEERDPKVTHALCAHCLGKELFHGQRLVPEPGDSKIKEVKSKLNQGYKASYVALPKLGNLIPYMTVDLKKTELIDIKSIAMNDKEISEETKYYRVASITSPFREQIVWAHMLNSCRPGVPDRNMELWAKEILTV